MENTLLSKMVWESDFESLCDCIARTIENFETILLWQPESDIVKVKHEAFIQKFSEEKGVLQLVEVDQNVFNFKEGEDVFIRFGDRSLLFKANIRKMSRDKIQVLIPKKFRIIENRDHPRNSLIEQDIKVKVDLDVKHKVRNSSFDFNVLDLNKTGIGVIFSVTKVNYFNIGQQVFISKFGNVLLDEKIRCEVMHVTKIEKTVELITNRDYKMGLKFLDQIPFLMDNFEAQ